ncbi:PIN domain-containing protein [Rhodohalobacter sulfatireducens]|uniref:PIN domain-containing protein n=1 Tax=Rhodohalobacter sulfatireducens TaxID=2911366 RepID=A0ABS9K9T1_9BACT|nr:PIN domain-containing protein [Rhodohalobacter sulfatireducens]MCG2587588.1 PIN domain-containing protein [Rhodohalobacter sulfatireducens]
MVYKNVLLDTKICLDVILDRKPFAVISGEIINKAELGVFSAFVAAHSFDTLFYILENKIGRKQAYVGIEILRNVCLVADVSKLVIDNALKEKWPDFEDAIHYQAALNSGCDAIVTRNPSDFKKASLPVLSPQQFLAKVS